MPLKVVEVEGTTYAEVKDGKPVYVGDDGAEALYDGEELAAHVTRLNGESATRRRELREAQEKLGAFDGIEDPEAARKALTTVKNLDDKKLVDAGEVDKVKEAAIQATKEQYENQIKQQYEPGLKERDDLKTALHKEMIGGRFARSAFISEKVAVPTQMVEATYGPHFSIEDGKVVAKDTAGNQIYSKSKPGEVADFEEALQILIDTSPFRDSILRGPNKNGSGAPGSGGGGAPGEKTITRAEYDTMMKNDPAGAHKFVADGGKVTE